MFICIYIYICIDERLFVGKHNIACHLYSGTSSLNCTMPTGALCEAGERVMSSNMPCGKARRAISSED